jgi:competence protein ComEC
MRMAALGFFIGSWWLQRLAHLPPWQWSLLLPVLLVLAVRYGRWRLPVFIAVGFLWAAAVGHWMLTGALDSDLEGKDVVVEGTIASLPETDQAHSRFQFQPQGLWLDGKAKTPPGRLLLSWYGKVPPLRVGEVWRLQVRLKRPHGFMNPGGFDYEAWLFRQGIRAKGYVRSGRGAAGQNRRLQAAQGRHPIDGLRQWLRAQLATVLADRPQRGLVTALAIGDRQDISRAQWTVLTRTGTNHLMAISGLHIGLVAGLAFFLGRWLWSRRPRAALRWPAPKAGAVLALLAATAYALLAGLSVPTQRALVMVAVVMLGLLLQRRLRPSTLLATALLVVLMADPLAVLAPGFWLSFAAVTVILLGMGGRVGQPGLLGMGERVGRPGLWWRWGRVQWLVALGLLPLLLWLFQKASLVSPLANLVAVPWVSLVTVPLTLTGTLLLPLLPFLAKGLLVLSSESLDLLWGLLAWLSHFDLAQWHQTLPPAWAVVCAVMGAGWLLTPRGLPARWLGVVWLLPLFVARPAPLAAGEAEFTLLDVGQGLAAVVQTRSHVVVFDTGPRFRSGFNTGEAVVAPFLRARGIGRVDLLVVSHGDNDHRGGVPGLVAEMPVTHMESSVPQLLSAFAAAPCVAGEHWQWDGVRFAMLHPGRRHFRGDGKGNNRSCVLRVDAGDDSVLLSGDIERGAERYLVNTMPAALDADVLVVPHHGSRTSSSAGFVTAVAPRFALFPVGYRNRYGFPKPQIVARYRRHGARLLDTARHGAIDLHLGGATGVHLDETYRQAAAHYWTARAAPVAQ